MRKGGIQTIACLAALVVGCGDGPQDPTFERDPDPFAHAGTGSTYLVGTTVSLDATASLDPAGGALGFFWSVESRPPGSSADVEAATSAVSSLELDAVGDYEVELTVRNAAGRRSSSLLRLSAEPPVIELDAGADQTLEWRVQVDLTAAVAIEGDRPVTVLWELVEVPDGSLATLTGETEVNASFVPDEAGRYLARVTATTPYDTLSDEVVIRAHADQFVLDHLPIAITYAEALDRFVTVSDAPPMLHLVDPAAKTQVSVPLPLAPRQMSLGLDGNRVTVGHENAVSVVTLAPLTVQQTVAVPTVIAANVFCVLDAASLVHCVAEDLFDDVRTLDLVAGTTTLGDAFDRPGAVLLSPSAQRLYIASELVFEIHSFDSSSPPVSFSGVEAADTRQRLWFMRDGVSIMTGRGAILNSSTDPLVDMTIRDNLAINRVDAFAESPVDGRLAVAVIDNLNIHDGASLQVMASSPIPDMLIGNGFRNSGGKVAAYRSDGSSLYVVANGGLAHTIFTLDP